MPTFEPEPELILETKEELLAALDNYEAWRSVKYETKSLWLCDLVIEMRNNEGFVYNSDVWHKARELLGLPPMVETQGTALSALVYTSQKYTRSDALREQGWEPFTESLLQRAFTAGKRVQIGSKEYAPKFYGKWAAWPKYSKKKAYLPDNDTPARIVGA